MNVPYIKLCWNKHLNEELMMKTILRKTPQHEPLGLCLNCSFELFLEINGNILPFQSRKGLEYVLEKMFNPEKLQTVITGIPLTQNF